MDRRWVGIVVVLLLAPVTAELLQACLRDLGGPLGMVSFVIFLAPLYGGAALLIREVCVRARRGWPGRLLLAAAFGVAMPTYVDQSLFIADRADIAGWSDLVQAAEAGGIGWYAALTWTAGHVLLSITAPTVIGETLARRPGPWLGRVTGPAVALAMVGVAVLLHRSPEGAVSATVMQRLVAAVVVLTLVAAALTPWGRLLALTGRGRATRVPVVGVVAFVLLLVCDFTPPGWPGLVGVVALSDDETATVGEYVQSGVYLLLLLALGAAMLRATRPRRAPV